MTPIRSMMDALRPVDDGEETRDHVVEMLVRNQEGLSKSMKIGLTDQNELIIVLCGGKCGSTALLEFFRGEGMPVLRIHNMDHFVEEHLRGMTPRPTFHELVRFLHRYYKMIYVVDAYRDPIERRMSSFFQNFRFNLERMGVSPSLWKKMSTEERMAMFEESGIPILERRNGIDSIYHDFFTECYDFQAKRQVMDRDGLRLIKLRFVDIDEWARILRPLIPGLSSHTSMPRTNMTADSTKWGAEYSEWRRSFRLRNPGIFWFLVMDPVFHKYHTMEEMVEYHANWLNKKE